MVDLNNYLREHNDEYKKPDNIVAAWMDELVRDWMQTEGSESTMSRVDRTVAMLHDGLSQGLEKQYRDLPHLAGDATACYAQSAVVGIPLSLLTPLGSATLGTIGAHAGNWTEVAIGLGMPAIPKLSAMRDAVMDYWNHPESRQQDCDRIAGNATIVTDTAARFAGLRAGGQFSHNMGLYKLML